jgi:hypothetical protein
MNKFELDNWLKYPPVGITPGKGKQLSPEFNSRLLLVRWTRAGATPEMVGELEGVIRSPFGTPTNPLKSFQVSKIPDFYEFWNFANDGLPYKLRASLGLGAKFGTQLTVWEFIPLIFDSLMGTVNNPPQSQQSIDLNPLVTAINNNGSYLANIQGQQATMLQRSTPGTVNAFSEITVKEFTGQSLNHKILGQDLERRSVSISVPAIDAASGQPNVNVVFVAIGSTDRTQFDDYDYTISSGGSMSLTTDEAAQPIACWQNIGTTSTLCNLTTINT